jgi:hypothetical protein
MPGPLARRLVRRTKSAKCGRFVAGAATLVTQRNDDLCQRQAFFPSQPVLASGGDALPWLRMDVDVEQRGVQNLHLRKNQLAGYAAKPWAKVDLTIT